MSQLVHKETAGSQTGGAEENKWYVGFRTSNEKKFSSPPQLPYTISAVEK
jgi:hypothetical protein